MGREVDADALDYAFGEDCGDIQTFEERKGVSAGHRHVWRGPFNGQSLFAVWAVEQAASAEGNNGFSCVCGRRARFGGGWDPGTLLAPLLSGSLQATPRPLYSLCPPYIRRGAGSRRFNA